MFCVSVQGRFQALYSVTLIMGKLCLCKWRTFVIPMAHSDSQNTRQRCFLVMKHSVPFWWEPVVMFFMSPDKMRRRSTHESNEKQPCFGFWCPLATCSISLLHMRPTGTGTQITLDIKRLTSRQISPSMMNPTEGWQRASVKSNCCKSV